MKPYKLSKRIQDEIILKYTSDTSITLRELSKEYNIHHITISCFLKRNNIKVRRTGARIGHPVKKSTREIFSKLHSGNQYTKGQPQTVKTKLKIIATKWNIPYSDMFKYDNYEKVKQIITWLNSSRNVPNFDSYTKVKYLDHFYNDIAFNKIWDIWLSKNKNIAYKPSIDHKVPYTRGGDASLSNLHVITWFENRAKGNMTLSEWCTFKKINNLTCDLFIDESK